jgi:hypothetical protein
MHGNCDTVAQPAAHFIKGIFPITKLNLVPEVQLRHLLQPPVLPHQHPC